MVDLWISVLFSWSHFPMGSRKFSMHCFSGSLQCNDVELLTMAVSQILSSWLGVQHIRGLFSRREKPLGTYAKTYVVQICCLYRQLTRIWDTAYQRMAWRKSGVEFRERHLTAGLPPLRRRNSLIHKCFITKLRFTWKYTTYVLYWDFTRCQKKC